MTAVPRIEVGGGRRSWRSTLRLVAISAALGALASYALMGGFRGSSVGGGAAQNVAAGFVSSVRLGSPAACAMMTPHAQSELVRLLGASPSRVAGIAGAGGDVCGTVLSSTPAATRERIMRWFSQGNSAGESDTPGGVTQWNQAAGGRYGMIELRPYGDQGWLVSSLRIQWECGFC
jgi:hypothetical protein